MKIRLNNYKDSFNRIWRLAPSAILLIFSSIAFQSAGANSVSPEHVAVSVIKRALPTYPQYAVKNGIEGTVLVSFSIEIDGNVSDIQVAASDHDGLFDASAILGVQKWVYTRPVKKIRNNYVAIEFALTDKPATSYFSNVEKIQVRGN
ncbi:energy transducer TonB [Catenovulum sp. SX2]|uniref:energy transducer TonB n=1 Tax=Catenovulum sp. SX2 TaxID=3398614 RepID=UPI003F841263